LELLKQTPLMPLSELFAVKHDSPQYNESSRQGIFYAESWLLTQFLMAGDEPGFRARFGQYTILLRQGENTEEAFTNAMQVSLPVMEAQLQRYFNNQWFQPVHLKAVGNIAAAVAITTHTMTPVEIYFRLGDELLRIDRPEAAGAFFDAAQKLAPASPLPYEGQGLLAVQQERPADALRFLTTALEHGSASFLAYYIYAREQYRRTADGGERYAPLTEDKAAPIRGSLEKSLALMPDFAPAHELLGFFEMVQGDQPAEAEKQLEWAILLEPENAANVFTLAQFQFRNHTPALARQTLDPLLKSNVDAPLRERAEELIRDNPR
jgi:tetratricopeptide (TPR) repeat protein